MKSDPAPLFIKKINIKKLRHLSDIEINISESERKHLILTGKNGSGKTSLLLSIKDYIMGIENNEFNNVQRYKTDIESLRASIKIHQDQLLIPNQDITRLNRQISQFNDAITNMTSYVIKYETIITLGFSDYENIYNKYINGDLIFAFFDAKRTTNLSTPKGVTKIDLKGKYTLGERAGTNFIQHIVNLKADRSFARDDKKETIVNEIDTWFIKFENFLKDIFEDENLVLEFDRENYNFNILQSGHEKTDLNHLSDGYSAILNIITELMLRMEKKSARSYNLEGFVFIDELETHLHVQLQKKVLLFLTTFFPKIQFIITTHSPFIISSLENAVVFDLENKITLEDASEFSYSSIVEEYLGADSEYSTKMVNKMEEFERIVNLENRAETDEIRLAELDFDLSTLRPLLSSEMYYRYKTSRKKIEVKTN